MGAGGGRRRGWRERLNAFYGGRAKSVTPKGREGRTQSRTPSRSSLGGIVSMLENTLAEDVFSEEDGKPAKARNSRFS